MQPFVIPLNGLKAVGDTFEWAAGREFFSSFENSEILDADLTIGASAKKSGKFIGVDCDIQGTVTVCCDRCMEDLVLPVNTGIKLSIKFGEDTGEAQADDREIVMVQEGEAELDLSQTVYDYVCLALPFQRVHPEGGCNPEALKHLSSEDEEKQTPQQVESPFAMLKNMLEK